MNPLSLSIGLKDRRIQLFKDGVWTAEVEIDWATGRCRHIPRRVAEAKALIDELLVVLQCRCLLLSPDKFDLNEGMVKSLRSDAAIPLFLFDGRRSLTVTVADVSAEILQQSRAQNRAILVSYRNLDVALGNPIPKLMGMHVLSVSEFPKEWAHVDQVGMLDLLPSDDRTHLDYQENFRLAVG